MGMVHAVQTGKEKAPSANIARVAKTISKTDAKHFASTKTKGLPEKVSMDLNKLSSLDLSYIEGFVKQCAARGVDPEELLAKKAGAIYNKLDDGITLAGKGLRHVKSRVFDALDKSDAALDKVHKTVRPTVVVGGAAATGTALGAGAVAAHKKMKKKADETEAADDRAERAQARKNIIGGVGHGAAAGGVIGAGLGALGGSLNAAAAIHSHPNAELVDKLRALLGRTAGGAINGGINGAGLGAIVGGVSRAAQ